MPKPKHPPAFLFYPDDFSSDGKVEAMTTEQVGAYILLLCKSWSEDPPGSIPDNDCVLARWARLIPDRWMECRDGVLAAFKLGTDSRWHQKRQRIEYEKLKAIRKERSAAAQVRWNHEDTCKCTACVLQKQSIPSSSSSSNQNIKSKAKAAPPALLPDWVPAQEWKDFCEMRQRIRAPMTEAAKRRILADLSRFRDSGSDPGEVLGRSVERAWRGVFAVPKENGNRSAVPAEVKMTPEQEETNEKWRQGILEKIAAAERRLP